MAAMGAPWKLHERLRLGLAAFFALGVAAQAVRHGVTDEALALLLLVACLFALLGAIARHQRKLEAFKQAWPGWQDDEGMGGRGEKANGDSHE